MRASYATMSCNVRKAIKAASVDLDDLKDFIISCDSSLEGKINDCDSVSSVLCLIDKECSLVDITLFCGVVEHFKKLQKPKNTLKNIEQNQRTLYTRSPLLSA